MKKLYTLLLAACLLPGCVPAVFVAGATAGGAVVYDKRSMDVQVKDQKIRFAVTKNIDSNPEIKHNSHISAAVFNGIVLLVGQTSKQRYSYEAVRAARNVTGIKRIYNRIEIAQPASLSQISNDTWLTTKIKAAMVSEKGLHASQIKVITENGIVYLMGIVNQSEARLATNISSQVPGVKRVIKLFEYTG